MTVPVRGGEVTSATVFRGPRLKTGIDIGQVLARLHTMTGRMTYRGKVMNRAARISAAASSGQVRAVRGTRMRRCLGRAGRLLGAAAEVALQAAAECLHVGPS